MFGRDPDPEGFELWVGMMRDGVSVRKVVAGFSEADEYKKYFGNELRLSADTIPVLTTTADVAWDDEGNVVYPGNNQRDRNRGASAFVKRMYTITLDRADAIGVDGGIDVGGLNAHSGAIVNGYPCWKIAVNFFDNEEFRSKDHPPAKIVEIAYAAILGRTPEEIAGDVAGRTGWTKKLENKELDVVGLVWNFCNSPEFEEKVCAPCGLKSGVR